MVILPPFDLKETPIAGRQEIRGYIEEFSTDIGYPIYDTTNLIAEHGRQFALAGDGATPVHYSHSFHHTILNEFRPYLHDVYEQVNSANFSYRKTA